MLSKRICAAVLAIVAAGCGPKGQQIGRIVSWAPPHHLEIVVINERAEPIELLASDGAAIEVGPGDSFEVPFKLAMTVPLDEFEVVDDVASRPRAGTGSIGIVPREEGNIITTPDAFAHLKVRVAPDEEWEYEFKFGMCLFEGAKPEVRIGETPPLRRIDLCPGG